MKKDNRLQKKLLGISIFPIIIMGVFFAFVGIMIVKTTNEDEIYKTLDGVCLQTKEVLVHQFPGGGYREEHGKYYIGDKDMESLVYYIDDNKEYFGTEVTVFIGDERAITTICDENGKRITGSVLLDSNIYQTVCSGEKYIADDIIIYDKKYYGEYIPIYDKGEVVGMIFAGFRNESFIEIMVRYYFAIGAFTIVTTIITILIVMQYSRRIAEDLEEIKEYFGRLVKKQDSELEISDTVLERKDEIGDLGRYATEVGKQLKQIIGHDPLTGVYNRRSGLQYLGNLWDKAQNGDAFTVVMCDIDFFKNVNDKYGHDMGDAVLVKITAMLQRFFGSEGCVIRWGGEEFVIGVPFSEKKTVSILEKLREELKRSKFTHKDGEFFIEMTFGVEEYEKQENLHNMINGADSKLYKGKVEGRDRIVCKIDSL